MDGSVLPPPPTPGNFQAPPAPGTFLPPVPPPPPSGGRAGQPVGRPSADPEQQEARIERSAERKRLMAILPKQMVDGKLVAVRLSGRHGKSRPTNKACLTILFSELEAEKDAVGDSFDTSRYVRDKLEEKFKEGRFLIEARDKKDKLLPEFGEFEVNLSDEDDDTEEGEDVDTDEVTPDPYPPRYDSPTPPPPPPFDPAVFAREVRQVTAEEAKRSESTTNVVMQLMMAAQQDAARRDEERRREEREERRREQEREERRREEELRRQEREDQREKERAEREREARRDLKQTLLALVPMVLPVVGKLMEGKPDTLTPFLLKMVDGKNDREGYKELMTLSSEASKQALSAQTEATKHLLATQAEGSKHVIANVMDISKAMVQNMLESQSEEESDDPMDKVSRVFKMLAPAISGLTQPQAAAHLPAPQPTQQPQQPQQQAQHTPADLIRGGLYTLAKLETGELAPEQRIPALQWCCRNLPSDMITAIKSGDEGTIMSTAAVGMDQPLTNWLMADAKHQDFLRKCLDDMKRMLVGAFTQADAQASIAYQVAYQQAKTGGAAPAPSEPSAVPEASAKPAKPGKRMPPPPPPAVELAEPPEAPAKPAATPSAEAKAADKPAA